MLPTCTPHSEVTRQKAKDRISTNIKQLWNMSVLVRTLFPVEGTNNIKIKNIRHKIIRH